MKMHGLGNDFLVVDSRAGEVAVDGELAARLADRRRAVGFDQLAIIRTSVQYDAQLVFYNADGSLSAACGNATRCIARFLMSELEKTRLALETERGVLECREAEGGMTSVNMGNPMFDWQEIPLSRNVDTLSLPIDGNPVGLGMGNPHCVFIVADAETEKVEQIGPEIEYHPLYPQRTNVEFVSITGKDAIRLRIWERGAGVTMASGSGACAAAVATARRGLTGRKVSVHVDGGVLEIDWQDEGVWMTGSTAHVFDGELTPGFLGSS